MKFMDNTKTQPYRPAVCALALMVLVGCATPPEAPRTLKTPSGRSLRAGFVYEEDVYSVGAPFSLEDLYWGSFFPQAASAFKEAHRFDSLEEALRSGVDVLIVGEATVHGARKGFKVTLEMVCLDTHEKELMRHGFREKTLTEDQAPAAFEALGEQAGDILTASRKVRKAPPRGASIGM